MNKILTLLILFGFALQSCQNNPGKKDGKNENSTIVQKVNEINKNLTERIAGKQIIASLDHHSMAKEEGVYTPPSIAMIFSDPKINSEILKQNQLSGLDLPFKTLCYSEADTSDVWIAYTSGAFIEKRHGLVDGSLTDYSAKISSVVEGIENAKISESNLDSLNIGYGIIKIQSDFNYEKTIVNLKNIVNAQPDTRWFGDIDFQKDAKAVGIDLNPTTLLLFGGPAPGGKAMVTTPKIGLDAFCQKLLVYQKDSGEVWIAFNDIVAFSNLYYGFATQPQNLINERLIATFTKAIRK